jgi:hypothetical protein
VKRREPWARLSHLRALKATDQIAREGIHGAIKHHGDFRTFYVVEKDLSSFDESDVAAPWNSDEVLCGRLADSFRWRSVDGLDRSAREGQARGQISATAERRVMTHSSSYPLALPCHQCALRCGPALAHQVAHVSAASVA